MVMNWLFGVRDDEPADTVTIGKTSDEDAAAMAAEAASRLEMSIVSIKADDEEEAQGILSRLFGGH